MKTVACFNNKGGVGKTTLVYHLAWMYADLGLRVIVADLDPQANVSSMFLDELRLEQLWPEGPHPESILGAVEPLIRRTGDAKLDHIEEITESLGLLVGDLGLSRFEGQLSGTWAGCADEDEGAFLVTSAFHRLLGSAAECRNATLVLMDMGPNLGALNRAALIAADFVVVPLAPDLFSLQGFRNLGPTLREWRKQWGERRTRNPNPSLSMPEGRMCPAGYVIHQHAVRLDRPVKSYEKWVARIPAAYRTDILNQSGEEAPPADRDPHCLASLKHYRSLMPMAQEAHKPVFHLKAADGALGAHVYAVQQCYHDFKDLAESIAEKCQIPLP